MLRSLFILAWKRETEISVTLMSASWPLPTLMNYLSLMLITWTILMFCKVTLSKTIKSSSGLSKSKISIGWPSYYNTFLGSLSLSVIIVPSE